MSFLRTALAGLDAATRVALARFGAVTGYVKLGEDGIQLYNDATQWDDLRVSPNGLPQLGSNPPIPEIVTTSEPIVTTAYSIAMDGSNGKGLVPYYSDMNTGNLSINFWMVANDNNIEFIDRNATSDGFELYHTSNRIYFKPGKGSSDAPKTDYNSIVNGGKYMVTVTCSNQSSGSEVMIYINGDLKKNTTSSGQLDITNVTDGYIIGEYAQGGWNYDGNLDNMLILNTILTQTQVTELYNAGGGINGIPTGITETTDVIAKFLFDEGTGSTVDNASTLGAGKDITLSGTYTWDTALVDGTVQLHSFGVSLDAYYKDVVMEKFFTAQFPHKKKMDTVIYPHVHWYGEDLTAGDVVWKLEFIWNQAGKKMGYTQTVERVEANDTTGEDGEPVQRMNNLPSSGIAVPYTGEHVSSTMICRLYRDGTDSRDTYTGKVYLHEFDFHVEMDIIGSKTSNSK